MHLNIQYDLFSDSRLKRLVRLSKESELCIVGTLVGLWYHSQKLKKISASKDQILEWIEHEDKPEVIDHLVTCRFLRCQKDGTYRISGNESELTSIQKYIDKATPISRHKGGSKRAKTASRGPNGRFLPTVDDQVGTSLTTVAVGIQDSAGPAQDLAGPAQNSAGPGGPSSKKISSLTSSQLQSQLQLQLQLQENKKRGKVSTPGKWAKLQTDFDRQTAECWMTFAKSQTPYGKFKLDKFTESITKMRVKFEMTEHQIEFLLGWVQTDDFWRNNAISPASLLKPSKSNPEITKLEQVILNLQNRKKTETEKIYDTMQQVQAELEIEDDNIFGGETILLEGS